MIKGAHPYVQKVRYFMPNLDFSSVPSREPLATGTYVFRIEHVEEKTSSSGNHMMVVRFKEQDTGNAIWENYVLLPQNLWKLKELCDAVGIDTSSTTESTEIADALLGAEVLGNVTQEEYNGRITNRMKKVTAC